MNANTLGFNVGVSESTVVRFATEIGYKGYPEFQKAMQEIVKNKLTYVQRINLIDKKIGESDVLDEVLNQEIRNIKSTLNELSCEEFSKVVNAVVQARNVYILFTRSSVALGNFLGYYYNLILNNIKIIHISSEAEIYDKLFKINQEDLVIGISFPRYSKSVVSAMKFARSRNAKIVAITDSTDSPITKFADNLLLAKSNVISIVDSLVAPLSLINALIVMTVLKKKNEVLKIFQDLEKIWGEYNVYE